jgi:excisionase family DNA binding protein
MQPLQELPEDSELTKMSRSRSNTQDSMQSEKRTQSRFWDKRQLAEYLGISIYTVDAWVSQRRIPFLKIGGRKVVFDKLEIDEWINEQRVEPILEDKGLDF